MGVRSIPGVPGVTGLTLTLTPQSTPALTLTLTHTLTISQLPRAERGSTDFTPIPARSFASPAPATRTETEIDFTVEVSPRLSLLNLQFRQPHQGTICVLRVPVDPCNLLLDEQRTSISCVFKFQPKEYKMY